MRLKRLDLTRYGKFTDYRLELDDKPLQGPDLHIIVGPNEAGKSTAFSGWLDLLFEIEPTSRYGFKHGYSSMQVGGVLEWNGQSRELVRVKRQTGSLRDEAGNAVDPALLSAALHGLTRDGYKNMFSLDDITIEKGGKDILASKGEVGEMLFAASAGLPELARAMDDVRSEARKFHAPRLRSSRLSTLKQELKRIEAELREADIPASQYQRLADELEHARKALGDARNRKRTCEAAHARLAAIADVQAMTPDLARLETGLEELGGPAGFPETLEAELERLARDEAGFLAATASLRERLDGVDAALAGLQADELILTLKPRILAAREAEARHLSASADLPRRREEHAAATTEIAAVLSTLGLPPSPETAGQWAQAGQIERLSQAVTSLQACEFSHAAAVLELERNERVLAEIESDAGDATPASPNGAPADTAALLAALEPDAMIARQDAAKAALDDAAVRFSARVRHLAPWQGDEARFVDLAPPAMDAAKALREEAVALAQATRALADRIVQCEAAFAQSRETLAGHAGLRTAPDDGEAQRLRHQRDAAWQLHLGKLDRDSAHAFEAAMRADDAANATRLAASGEIAALREAGLAVARLTGERAALKTEQEDLASRQGALDRAFLSLLEGSGLEAGLSPAQLPDWLERYQGALEEHSALQRCRATVTRLDEAVQAACIRIADHLAMPLPKPGNAAGLRMLATLLARRVHEEAAQAARAESRGKALTAARDGVRQRRAQRDEADRARQSAEAELRDALADYPPALAGLTTSALAASLPILRRLPALLMQVTDLSHRIATMVADQAVFAQMAGALAKAAGEEAGGDPVATLARLTVRLQRGEQEAARRTVLEADRTSLIDRIADAQVALDAIGLQVSAHADRFEGMEQTSGLTGLREAAQRDRQARQMAGEARRLEGLILQRLGVSSRAEADGLLDNAAGPEFGARLAAAASENAEAGAALEAAIAREAGARAALEAVGSDDRAAHLEEERVLLLETIAEEAREALQLRLGLMAAERALMRYRDENRSSMLADTAAAFATITGGEFPELRTIPDGSGEALVAIRGSDRGSITAQDMSKGTRFQLYLALRIAGYRRFCEAAGPLPFVADDIFESFDDGRTRAALLLMGEIGKLGQALYFTHHEHVATLAREVFGDQVRLHRLTG